MADLVLVIGEYGFNIDFTVYDADGKVDLDTYDTAVLTIKTTDFVTTSLTKSLSAPGDEGVVRWTVVSGNVPTTAGLYYGQIVLTDTGDAVRKTRLFDILVQRKLD